MSEMAKVFNLPEEFEFAGKTYKLGRITGEVEAAWESHLEDLQWAALRRSAARFVNYPDQEAKLRSDIGSGKYAFDSEASTDYQWTFKGRTYLVFLRMKSVDPMVTLETVVQIMKKERERLEQVLARLDDPNPTAPTAPQPSGEKAEKSSEAQGNASNESLTPSPE